MKVNINAVMNVVRFYRDANKREKFLLDGEVADSDLTNNAETSISQLGWSRDEKVLAVIDNSISDARRAMYITSRGVYVYQSGEAQAESQELGSDGKSDFVSWDRMSAPYDDEFRQNVDDWTKEGVGCILKEDDKFFGEYFVSEDVGKGVVEFIFALRDVAANKECAMAKEPVSLTPRKVTDVNEVAKLWSHVRIGKKMPGGRISERADVWGGWEHKDAISEVNFVKALELKRALYALKNPEFSKIISVEAMTFPALYCTCKVKKEEKWYEEVLFKDGEREDLLPLADKRIGRDDPWKDERFKLLDENCEGNYKARIDSDTCIWVECKDCRGEGGHKGRVFAGIGDEGQIECTRCGGSGKIGVRTCPECKGFGRYYSYSQVKKFKSGWVTCETCGGKGKMKSVLRLNHVIAVDEEKRERFFIVPDGTIPSALTAEDDVDFSKFLDYRELCKAPAVGGLSIPNCGIDGNVIKSRLAELHRALLPARAHCIEESVSVGICTRYVRFHLRFLVGAVDYDNDGSASKIAESAAKGILPKDYFTRMPHMRHKCDMVLWMDMLDGRIYGKFPAQKNVYSYVDNQTVLLGILMKMGMSVSDKNDNRSAVKPKENCRKRTVDKVRPRSASSKDKKRWKFVLLGLLFGWFGAHFMYAKRWLMLLLMLGSFATGVVMMNKSESNQKEVPVQTEQQTEGDASKGNSEAIGAVCLVLWLVMWLGGALFVKKDGKGNRM